MFWRKKVEGDGYERLAEDLLLDYFASMSEPVGWDYVREEMEEELAEIFKQFGGE